MRRRFRAPAPSSCLDMKHFLSTLLITLAVIGVISTHARIAFAQVPCDPAVQSCQEPNMSTANGEVYVAPTSVDNLNKTPPPSANTQDLNAAGRMSVPPSANTDSWLGSVMTWIMTLFAWLLGVAAITLDNAVYFTVVTMGDVVNDLSAIGVAWRILRDIGNIFLIFGFLAIGISIILGTELFGWKSNLLPKLLISAVLLNFSLFMTEAVVDVGNLFATQFYTQINGGQPAEPTNYSGFMNEGISNKIMGQVGLQRIYGDAMNNTLVFAPGSSIVIGFMGIILFMITGFVMFALAFILIARFVVLVFIIIAAPVGFAGYAIPKLEGMSKKWRDELFSQTIIAPILLLMLYIALAVITDVQFLTGFGVTNGSQDSAWTAFIGKGDLTGFAGMILSYLVAMGMLLAVVIFSKKLGAFGGEWATKAAGKVVLGGTAWGMRTTVGWGSYRAAQALRTTKFGSSKTGRLTMKMLDRGAKGSFDARASKAWKEIPFGGIDAGKIDKVAVGGYRAKYDKNVKEYRDYLKSVTDAIGDRGNTKEQQTAINDAAVKRLTADKNKSNAEDEHATAKQQYTDYKAEVARLEKEKENPNLSLEQKIEVDEKLNTTRQNLKTSEDNLATATTKLTEAAEQLKTAKKTESDAKGALSEEKKEAEKRYVKNIEGKFFGSSFPGWVMFGAGAPQAARKIIKDSTKSDADKAWDDVKKVLKAKDKKEGEEEGGEEGGNDKEKEKNP